MADIRIKDLTTTASSSASDDFVAVDGTTNGTRKLNAYSPSFGGNATVGGTLTVTGATTLNSTLTCNTGTIVAAGGSPPSSGRGVELQHNGTNGYIYAYNRNTSSANPLYLNHTGGNLFLGNITSVASIVGTTDSTTKDTGCLVLEGGLGVEKNIVAGLGIAARGTLTLPAAWTGTYGIGIESDNATATSRIFFGDGTGYALKFASRASSTTTDRMTLTDGGNLTISGTLQLGNAYVAGAPTATGYIVIKDSTGTSYKIPAQAL